MKQFILHFSRFTPHASRFTLHVLLLSSLSLMAQNGLEKKTVATLGPGETLAYGESYFRLDQPSETFSFVTVTGSGNQKEYYCYGKDGVKTGPFKQPDPSFWAGNEEAGEDDCIADDLPHTAGMAEYIDFSNGTVTLQGKEFGPYGTVIHFAQPANEQSFFAVAMTAEMKFMGFDSFGRKITLSGMPEEIIVSPDGKNALVKVKGVKSPLDPDYFQYIMDHPEEGSNPGIYLLGFDGRNYGPYPSSSFRDCWYTELGQPVIFANQEVFLNGSLLCRVEGGVAACDLWFGSDGKECAWATYEKLAFSDGSAYPAPIVITTAEENGRKFLKWLSLEEGKNLVFYQKPF